MHCYLCGRFVKRVKEPLTPGLPLTTGFPPDKPQTASSLPYAAFSCSNSKHWLGVPKSWQLLTIQYFPVNWQEVTND